MVAKRGAVSSNFRMHARPLTAHTHTHSHIYAHVRQRRYRSAAAAARQHPHHCHRNRQTPYDIIMRRSALLCQTKPLALLVADCVRRRSESTLGTRAQSVLETHRTTARARGIRSAQSHNIPLISRRGATASSRSEFALRRLRRLAQCALVGWSRSPGAVKRISG